VIRTATREGVPHKSFLRDGVFHDLGHQVDPSGRMAAMAVLALAPAALS
jgi:hypothetical protein